MEHNEEMCKTKLAAKSDSIRHLKLKVLDLERKVRNARPVKVKSDRLETENKALLLEKSDWVKKKQSMGRQIKDFERQKDEKVQAKYAHQKDMAKLMNERMAMTMKGKEEKEVKKDERAKQLFVEKRNFRNLPVNKEK